MMEAGKSLQLRTEELKVRELSEEYLRIEENTEFLTHILRFTPHRHRVLVKVETQPPDLRSLAALGVQLAYLLFTCHVKRTNLLLNPRPMLLHSNRKDSSPEVCMEYILEKDFLQLRQEEQKALALSFMRHELATEDPRSYGRYVISHLNAILSWARPQFQRLKNPADKLLAKQFISLDLILRNYLEPQLMQIPHPRVVILSLEESELFREHSTLVKVMNNSLFSAVRSCRNKAIFNEITQLEANLAQVRTVKGSTEGQAQQIQRAIEELLLVFIKNQIMTVEQSINDQGKGEPAQRVPQSNSRQYNLGQIEGGSTPERRYFCRVLIHQRPSREFSPRVYQSIVVEAVNNYGGESDDREIDKTKQGPRNQFLIEYMPLKGLLSVKYVTAVELNIENTDLVMFQCNNIAYHWSNVSMQLVEKSQSKQAKRKERYLALKTISHLHLTEKPLFKLMLMLDLVMLCAKIAEPELKKTIIRPEDYNRIEEISLRVDHMVRLFVRKIEKYYRVIAEAEGYPSA